MAAPSKQQWTHYLHMQAEVHLCPADDHTCCSPPVSVSVVGTGSLCRDLAVFPQAFSPGDQVAYPSLLCLVPMGSFLLMSVPSLPFGAQPAFFKQVLSADGRPPQGTCLHRCLLLTNFSHVQPVHMGLNQCHTQTLKTCNTNIRIKYANKSKIHIQINTKIRIKRTNKHTFPPCYIPISGIIYFAFFAVSWCSKVTLPCANTANTSVNTGIVLS